jgi:hypothetical protein
VSGTTSQKPPLKCPIPKKKKASQQAKHIDKLSQSHKHLFIKAAKTLQEQQLQEQCTFTPTILQPQSQRRQPVFDSLFDLARKK